MLDKVIVTHCAPTLAGIKAAELICCDADLKDVERSKEALSKAGISLRILRKGKGQLIYIYREERLREIITNADNQEFLSSLGYENFELEALLDSFEQRLASGYFPHEIGIILDYPLVDVKGFMEDMGNCACASGYWQVYGDEEKTMALFSCFKRCTECYLERYLSGVPLANLAVAI